jgi:hypothetical protein
MLPQQEKFRLVSQWNFFSYKREVTKIYFKYSEIILYHSVFKFFSNFASFWSIIKARYFSNLPIFTLSDQP